MLTPTGSQSGIILRLCGPEKIEHLGSECGAWGWGGERGRFDCVGEVSFISQLSVHGQTSGSENG